jgi:hypothetical protein
MAVQRGAWRDFAFANAVRFSGGAAGLAAGVGTDGVAGGVGVGVASTSAPNLIRPGPASIVIGGFVDGQTKWTVRSSTGGGLDAADRRRSADAGARNRH